MAVNPTLAQDEHSGDLFPLPKGGEAFVLKREGIEFECTLVQGHKLWGRGCFFMSTKRIAFVASGKSCRADFRSFEIPLASLTEPKFQQPIFGANYLSGKVAPSSDPSSAPLGGIPTPFSLTFNEGGCGTFLPLFYKLLTELQTQEAGAVAQAAQDGELRNVAYVDPSDPSVLYITQPTPAPDTQEHTTFEVTFEPGELAEVVILEGRYTGQWVKCSIVGRQTWTRRRVDPQDYDSVGGFSDKDVPDIGVEHLRKAGSSEARPGPCSIDPGGCAVM